MVLIKTISLIVCYPVYNYFASWSVFCLKIKSDLIQLSNDYNFGDVWQTDYTNFWIKLKQKLIYVLTSMLYSMVFFIIKLLFNVLKVFKLLVNSVSFIEQLRRNTTKKGNSFCFLYTNTYFYWEIRKSIETERTFKRTTFFTTNFQLIIIIILIIVIIIIIKNFYNYVVFRLICEIVNEFK